MSNKFTWGEDDVEHHDNSTDRLELAASGVTVVFSKVMQGGLLVSTQRDDKFTFAVLTPEQIESLKEFLA